MRALALAAGAALGILAAPAGATKADRAEPMSIDAKGGSTVDLKSNTAVFLKSVVVQQGTLVINADRLELHDGTDGRKVGIATGTPANFRQKSDRPDEWTEGEASRIEYDSEANRVRFVGNAHLRVLKNGKVTDEGTASLISYDTQLETISFDNGAPRGGHAGTADGGVVATPGQVHMVISPRQLHGAASAPAPAASAGEPR